MTSRTIGISLKFSIFVCLTSCSIFNSGKKTTVTKTETTTQTTPLGNTETANVSRTETIVEKNKKSAIPSISSSSNTDTTTFPAFSQVITTRKKDTIIIHDTTYATKEKKVISYKADTTHKDTTFGLTGSDMDCYTTTVRVFANSSTFMNADYEAQAQHIYPGASYFYTDFTKGNYKEIDFPRNPIKLSADNPNITGSSWNLIENPDYSSIRDGIAALYSRFDNRQTGTMNLRYQTYETNTDAEFNLRLSGGASFATFSLENEYRNTSKSTSHNLTIDAIKPLYTITCLVPKPYKNYFKSKVGIDSNAVIIKSVTYGVRVLANFTLNTETKQDLDSFHAHYNGISSGGHLDFKYIENVAKTDQTINCYIVGGPGNSTVAFDKKQLEEGLQSLLAGATYATARPISYELQDLAGNIIETKSATDEITTQKCVPHVDEPLLEDVLVETITAKDNKDHDSHYAIFLKKGLRESMNHTGDCYLLNNIDMEYKSGTTMTEGMQSVNRSLKINDFINNNGGSVLFAFTANGDDTWDIANFRIILIFKDGTIKKIDFGAFSISEGQQKPFFFDRNFQNYER